MTLSRLMHLKLPAELDDFIKTQVGEGHYTNATEVVRDALRRLQREAERRSAFRRAVDTGRAELDRGEGREFTPKLMDEIDRQADEDEANGAPMEPDALP